jgi:hypothetical protein
MSLLQESEVRARAAHERSRDTARRQAFSARPSREILLDSVASFSEATTYDIFLSHSIRDADIVLGVKGLLSDLGYRVYVDWIEDAALDRANVTPRTAELLRRRMGSSRTLLYVTTENADNSRWMPWECGYFDGLRGKVAIVPVKTQPTSRYAGLEYLGLYPYCVRTKDVQARERLYVHRAPLHYAVFDEWSSKAPSEVTWTNHG